MIEGTVAIDMGVPFSAVAKHLKTLRIVFMSHEHSDHFNKSTIKKLAYEKPLLRFACGEWLAKPLAGCGVKKANIDILESGRRYSFGQIAAEPFGLYHPVPNMGWKLEIGGERALYATDTARMDHVEARDFDYYFIEANHTEEEIEGRIAEKLRNGEYPYEQRARDSHLSREKADEFIYGNIGPNGVYVYLHTHDGLAM